MGREASIFDRRRGEGRSRGILRMGREMASYRDYLCRGRRNISTRNNLDSRFLFGIIQFPTQPDDFFSIVIRSIQLRFQQLWPDVSPLPPPLQVIFVVPLLLLCMFTHEFPKLMDSYLFDLGLYLFFRVLSDH
jgi:hypothetical protein